MKRENVQILIFPISLMLAAIIEPVRVFNSTDLLIGVGITAVIAGIISGLILLVFKRYDSYIIMRLLFIVGVMCLIYFYIDMTLGAIPNAFDIFGFVDGARPISGITFLAIIFLIITFSIVFLLWRFRAQAIEFLTILFTAIFLISAIFSAQIPLDNSDYTEESLPSAAQKDDRLTLYLLFDAMIGSGGLRGDLPANAVFADEIDTFLQEYDFVNYENAFSRHLSSSRSIPAMLNNVSNDLPKFEDFVEKSNNRNFIIENQLFARHFDEYRVINVYQSEYIGYCRHEAVLRCNTTAISDPFSSDLPKALVSRFNFLVPLFKFQDLLDRTAVTKYPVNFLYRPIHTFAERFWPRKYLVAATNTPYTDLTFDSQFDSFTDDVVSSEGGIFFAHFVMPHFPFRVDEDCAPVEARFSERGYDRLKEVYDLSDEEAAARREELYSQYRDQARCVHKKLGHLFNRLKGQGRFDDTKVVLMGDHGSRISNGYVKELVSERDLIDNHSALFATKARGGSAGSDPRMLSIQQLLLANAGDEATPVSVDDEPTVVLRSNSEPGYSLVPMPKF